MLKDPSTIANKAHHTNTVLHHVQCLKTAFLPGFCQLNYKAHLTVLQEIHDHVHLPCQSSDLCLAKQ
jgi:hypothetical protein